MLESQLFGHRRGAFTGADRDTRRHPRGARRHALPRRNRRAQPELQPKLLRFLESGEICPLGETTPFIVNVRIVAATNANSKKPSKADGSARISSTASTSCACRSAAARAARRAALLRPSLRHEGDDRISQRTDPNRGKHDGAAAARALAGHIRQLQNELRRMIALADINAILTPASLSADVAGAATTRRPAATDLRSGRGRQAQSTLARIEREMIRAALQAHHGKNERRRQGFGHFPQGSI